MIETIEFSIYGNQENPDGNPIPYTRVTQGSTWSDKAQRYEKWKSYVVVASGLDYVMDTNKMKMLKPIEVPKGYKVWMTVMSTFMNETHPDSDNVFKGIADALFQNDKKVAGLHDFDVVKGGRGRVDVSIHIMPLSTFTGIKEWITSFDIARHCRGIIEDGGR